MGPERHGAGRRAFRTAAMTLLGALASCAGLRPPSAYPVEERLTAGIFLDPEERAVLPPGAEPRKVHPQGLRLTKEAEGFRPRLYEDAARLCTIGYGHLVKRAPCDGTEPPPFPAGLSEPQASDLLADDMGKAELVVTTAVQPTLADGQYAALCDFVFNTGGRKFRDSTLLRVVNAGETDRVAEELRRWVFAGGRRLPGLAARREREIELFFEGLPVPKAAPVSEPLAPIDILKGE